MVIRFALLLCLVFPNLGKSEFPPEPVSGDVLIDVGTPEVSELLGYGWSRNERAGDVTSAWIKQIEGDLLFDVDAVFSYDLHVRAKPLYLPGKVQKVAVYVNDRFITEWTCADSHVYQDYQAKVPSSVLRSGANRLTFRMAYKRRMPPDTRELSLNIDKVLFRKAAD